MTNEQINVTFSHKFSPSGGHEDIVYTTVKNYGLFIFLGFKNG